MYLWDKKNFMSQNTKKFSFETRSRRRVRIFSETTRSARRETQKEYFKMLNWDWAVATGRLCSRKCFSQVFKRVKSHIDVKLSSVVSTRRRMDKEEISILNVLLWVHCFFFPKKYYLQRKTQERKKETELKWNLCTKDRLLGGQREKRKKKRSQWSRVGEWGGLLKQQSVSHLDRQSYH